MSKRKYNKWKAIETKRLKSLYKQKTAFEISMVLGRSLPSIRYKIKALGLVKSALRAASGPPPRPPYPKITKQRKKQKKIIFGTQKPLPQKHVSRKRK